MGPRLVLILGGVKSGKSRFAQELAARSASRVLFVATAEPGDAEMRARIEAHRRERPPTWDLLEAPLRVGQRLAGKLAGVEVVILDCVTLLVSNLLLAGRSGAHPGAAAPGGDPFQVVHAEIEEFLRVVRRHPVQCLVVSNEVGMGIVPDNALARLYREVLGMANQILAQEAGEVFLLVAGIPVRIKGGGDCSVARIFDL
jgi:adenosylcobinamide kinase/adenosylcobinamide-phosphate guanylyltransferase